MKNKGNKSLHTTALPVHEVGVAHVDVDANFGIPTK